MVNQNSPDVEPDESSPYWSQSTKLVVGLTLVAVAAALVARFKNIVGPLLMAIILSYLLHPLVKWVTDTTRLKWRGAVNLIYLLFLILLIALLTLGGVALVQQLQTLVGVVTTFFTELPELAASLAQEDFVVVVPLFNQEVDLGPYIDQLNIDFLSLSQEILNLIQPALGRAGSLVATIAGSAFSTLGWMFFILLISYFTLADSGGVREMLLTLNLPGHQQDARRLGRELGRIWNAFLRGQLTLVLLTAVVYYFVMVALGVRNALALALVAALAKFLPYIGQWLTSGTIAVLTFFQTENYFRMEPLAYTLMVMLIVLGFDQVVDNLIAPRIFGQALGIHPAALLVTVLIMASLMGFIGVLLAAPALASVQLFSRYALRKMVDLEPWPDPEETLGPMQIPFRDQSQRTLARLKAWWARARTRKKDNDS
ncbi:MAG: AI-2E family transporter [Chloroflexi bacterium]|nr:AI-2E family transporter [Chloroflexota bacterium]